jgi:hypothetical protein
MCKSTIWSDLLLDHRHALLACLGEHRYCLRVSNQSKSKGRVQDLQEALRMLDVFASVGATHFDLTHLNIEGEKRGFRPKQTIAQIKNSLPKLFPGAAERQNNIIVRPYADKTHLIQLDDLDEPSLARVGEGYFLSLCTSPGNHQAWIAVTDLKNADNAKEFSRRLRKGAGADPSASGATRVAGTTNYKRKYEPIFPTVTIVHSSPGRTITTAQLDALGLVAQPEPEKPAAILPLHPRRVSEFNTRERHWPDYQRCLQGAPPSKNGSGPDRSMADYFWCKMAAQRNWSVEEIAQKLIEVSERARERVRLKDEGYVQVTAQNAFDAAFREKQRGRG